MSLNSAVSLNKVPTCCAGASQQRLGPRANKNHWSQRESSSHGLVITTVPVREQRSERWVAFEEHKAQSLQVNSVPTLQLVLWTWRHLFPHFSVGLLNCHLLLATAAAAPLLVKNLVLHDTDVGQVARWKTHCLQGFFLWHPTQFRRALSSLKRHSGEHRLEVFASFNDVNCFEHHARPWIDCRLQTTNLIFSLL